MLVCVVNGQKGYPSSSDKIKITYENQFIKDSGSYTYDISFPMKIAENQVLFGNVNRFDVKKILPDYEDCKLYADNRLVISGKGTITSITNDVVKLQIVGGKSRIKYNSKFESHYIDEIDYPPVVITKGIDRDAYRRLGITELDLSTIDSDMLFVDLHDWNYVGQPGIAAFNPINDEGNDDVIRNNITNSKGEIRRSGVRLGKRVFMTDLAVQPNLMYVLRKVIEYEGYNLVQNDFDIEPWNRLLVASAMQSVRIKDALPHWTVYSFFEEIRKFFNASIIFDELEKTARIVSANELISNEVVSYDCTDEFSSDYEDDGLSSLATSNIEYSFDTSAYRDWQECISQDIQKQFETKQYASVSEMVTAASNMSARERRTTIFKVEQDYYIWAMMPVDGDSENLREQRIQCGYFNPVVRDINSDDSIELKICPVTIYQRLKWQGESNWKNWVRILDAMPNTWICVPSVTNAKQVSMEELSADEDGNYYVSVQDAMESGSTEETAQKTEDSSMPVMFQGQNVINIEAYQVTPYNELLTYDEGWQNRLPITYTDHRMHTSWSGTSENASLMLIINHQENSQNIDKHHLITFSFSTDDIPDPSKIFVFRNKKYICQKVEIEVANGIISEMKKGYFYELI